MFTVAADQGDIVFSPIATCYGGPHDVGDNGIGAWDFPYRRFSADLLYCALPVRGSVPSLANSPIPAGIPHYCPVHIQNPDNGKTCWCFFVDYGPEGGLPSGAGIDLGPAVLLQLGITANPDTWSGRVNARIYGCGHLLGVK